MCPGKSIYFPCAQGEDNWCSLHIKTEKLKEHSHSIKKIYNFNLNRFSIVNNKVTKRGAIEWAILRFLGLVHCSSYAGDTLR